MSDKEQCFDCDVEREAALKFLRTLLDTYTSDNGWALGAREALTISIEAFEKGEHHK